MTTHNSFKYFLIIFYDHSRSIWACLMKSKLKVTSVFMAFYNLILTQSQIKVQYVRIDNGLEINMKDFFLFKGHHHTSNLWYLNSSKKFIYWEKVSTPFRCSKSLKIPIEHSFKKLGWMYSYCSTNHHLTPTHILNNKTLYQILYDKFPSYSNLKIFCYSCYALTLTQNISKLSPTARKCIIVGYLFAKKEYKLFDLDSKNFVISMDVVYETIFSFQNQIQQFSFSFMYDFVWLHSISKFSSISYTENPFSHTS